MPGNGEDENDDKKKVPGQEIHALVPQLSLTLYFGHDKEMDDDKKEVVPAAAATAPTDPNAMDADKDGIVDGTDKCPGTDPGITVNAVGCLPKD